MGLFSDAIKQTQQESQNKFKPLSLNEFNVQALFNRCLATKDTVETTFSALMSDDLRFV